MALQCPDPKCPNHESTDDNNFRGRQALKPDEHGTLVPDGPERFYCYNCDEEAEGTNELNPPPVPDVAIVPSVPQGLKSGDAANLPTDTKED